uniref:Uncharacterized protein n=1 Tax=Scleropages formosus TaxID=113540 RepID=A0A8C9RT35_SCLFO
MTMEASFSAREAFISPSAWMNTLARASRVASASAAMALWSCCGSLTSLISTRSTLIPQSSVQSPHDQTESQTGFWCPARCAMWFGPAGAWPHRHL